VKGLNQLTLIGNVGKDPESRILQSGAKVCNFTLAVNESWKNRDGEKQERCEWFNCVAWEKLSEIIMDFVHKGDPIYLQGRIQSREYEKDGAKIRVMDVVVSNVILLPNGKNGETKKASDPEPYHKQF
jgi:single-strand DNA-binding protein